MDDFEESSLCPSRRPQWSTHTDRQPRRTEERRKALDSTTEHKIFCFFLSVRAGGSAGGGTGCICVNVTAAESDVSDADSSDSGLWLSRKMLTTVFQSPKHRLQNCFFCPTNRLKPKDASFIIIKSREKQWIQTCRTMEPATVWHVPLKTDQDYSINKRVFLYL